MYLDDTGQAGSGAVGGWQVDPDRVRDFAAAVEQVRAALGGLADRVTEMSGADYAPMLGTSPVGQQMADKFVDRMGSEQGLRGQLTVALRHLENFVASAEKTAAAYQGTDADSAQGLRYS